MALPMGRMIVGFTSARFAGENLSRPRGGLPKSSVAERAGYQSNSAVAARRDVRYWHLADNLVRYWSNSGQVWTSALTQPGRE
jgi:hypothetical protein